MHFSRREILLGFLDLIVFPRLGVAEVSRADTMFRNNFRYVYGDATRREAFLPFLENVFHLYPEQQFHQAIADAVSQYESDRDIYESLMLQLPALKPMLADLTMALPALNKQKTIMAEQTLALLDERREIEGYLELGSSGRYLDALEEQLNIVGPRIMVTNQGATYSPVDVIDRGQIMKAGTDILLENYAVDLSKHVTPSSLDMVTVYIGFHHCPLALRDPFFDTIRTVLKPNGLLIVRDHDAHSEQMHHVVALAHDVFNLGTNETWVYNEAEFRAFYALDDLIGRLKQHGFTHDGRRLFQQGDPTRNALMLFRKIA